jgi:hypothetical protein
MDDQFDEPGVTLSPNTLQATQQLSKPMNRAHQRDLERRLQRVYTGAVRDQYERGCTTTEWAEGAGLRAVYELGRKEVM